MAFRVSSHTSKPHRYCCCVVVMVVEVEGAAEKERKAGFRSRWLVRRLHHAFPPTSKAYRTTQKAAQGFEERPRQPRCVIAGAVAVVNHGMHPKPKLLRRTSTIPSPHSTTIALIATQETLHQPQDELRQPPTPPSLLVRPHRHRPWESSKSETRKPTSRPPAKASPKLPTIEVWLSFVSTTDANNCRAG